MNPYLKNLCKIEFVVTYACTGRCKHCSEGSAEHCGERIDTRAASDFLRKVAEKYDIKTVMTFGGEPLLHPDAVCGIMATARSLGVPHRQVITNGYFSSDIAQIRELVRRLADSGVNDLLLSVDAFHQETIPLDIVRAFATELKKFGVPTRLQPAWLVSKADDNEYNRKTREILDSLADLALVEGEGNIVFFEGNAKKYLSEYFDGKAVENPYIENVCDVRCLSVSPNGDVLGGNMYRQDIIEIIDAYRP